MGDRTPLKGRFLSSIAAVRMLLRLLLVGLLLGGAASAHAAAFCSTYPLDPTGMFHVINGNDPTLTTTTLPSSIGIDANCYFENFQVSSKWPNGLTSTINFKQTTPAALAVFTNVWYTGNMSCSNTNAVVWFVNSTFAGNNQCQSLFIPVEAIGKAAPGPTATIGVPFTYTMTIPVMYSAGVYTTQPSTNTLANATIYDDLTTLGASVTYVSNTASLINGATVTPIGPLNLGASATTLASLGITSDSTKHIVFSCDNNPSYLCNIPAGTQIQIKLTVVLDNVPTNVAGTQFTNTAQWWFGRVINGVTYNPLPGQGGVAAPMTIVEPNLTLQKTSPYTNLNVGTAAPFTLNVQNTGGGTAWNTQITDVLPTGMCTYNPAPTATAQVFASDGVTPVSPLLVAGTDYTVSYGNCQLTLNMLSAAAAIPPTDRLLINYKAELDAGTAPGLTFTNVAGATLWYSGPSSTVGVRQYPQTLTNGTPGVLDFQDAYTITSSTQGYFFLKSVGDLTTGAAVATAAYPGDKLLYTFQIQNFTFPSLNNITVNDVFDSLNATPSFQAGTLALVSSNLPAGAILTVNPTGGPNGTGSFSISGLNLLSNQQYQVQFAINLAPTLTNGAVVRNQASMSGTDTSNVVWSGVSDDPYINGPSLLSTTGDPTPVTVNAPGVLAKANTVATATIGQQFTYQITVPATPVNVPLYDVRILDNLGASAANMSFVSASVVSGGAWSLINAGTATNLVLQDNNTGIDIPAGGQAVINVTVQLANTTTNVKGLAFANTASYTYDKVNGDATTQGNGGAATTANMTVVEPALGVAKAVSYASPAGKLASAPAAAGDVLQYTVTVTNNGTSTAYNTGVLDALPTNLALVAGSETATINGVAVTGFVQTPTTQANGMLAWGAQNGDTSLVIPVGGTLVLSFQATVLQANGTSIVNTAYADWTSLAGAVTGARTGAGCPIVTAPNTYCSGPATAAVTSVDPTAFAKAVASDTWATAPTPATLRAGDLVTYTLTATLIEGTTQNMVITDTLPANMVFDHVVSVNGLTVAPYTSVAPFTYASFTGPTLSNGGATSTWNFGNVYNAPDNNPANNNFVIQYAARVVNTIPATPTAQTLTNSASLSYAINGVAGTTKTASAPISAYQPMLGVSKTAATANGGTVLVPGELVTYTVTLTNTGSAPAYDPVLQDTLPIGMRTATPVTTSVSLINGATTTALPVLAPVYSGTTGVATWNFATGVANQYAIPPGASLQVVYQAWADSTIGAGMVLSNAAQATHYYSLDSTDANSAFRKDYGATAVSVVTLTTASPTALSKAATVTSAAIGQQFTYQITVPATPQATALYDVRVLDDISLAATGVSLNYVGASAALKSGAKTWAALTNSGTSTSLILSDATAGGGLDIPAGDQLIVTLTVVLANDPTNNTAGKQFTNTANYTYDSVNNNTATQAAGGPGASGPVTIIAPNLTMQKGGPATMLIGVPGTFTLNVQNTGTATAWNAVLSDILPSGANGGMCGAAPTSITARVYQSDGVTPVSAALANGTDFTVSWAAAPTCTLTVKMLSAGAAIPPTDRLILTYSAQLDTGTASGLALTNIAGATQWLSANPAAPGAAGNVYTFNNTLTNGTPGVLDFQDAFTTTSAAPVLTFTKAVFDVTSGQAGSTAKPGDTLQYTLTLTNTSAVNATNFSLTDTLDALNNPAAFVPGTLTLTAVPAGASTALTSSTGGSKGTGIVNISGLNVGAAGSPTATATIQFTARLVPAMNNGTVVLNQAQVSGGNIAAQQSTYPGATGIQPTPTTIASAPAWKVLKTVQDITSGTNVVMPGDVLQYTITVKNIGTENANNVTLTDAIPTFTTYVAGSTRLNGLVVADPAAGVSAVQNGMLINAPNNTTPGLMLADATASTGNVATITFQVKISATALSGTIISNQGFVNGSGATSGTFPAAPSDDPATPVLNDPTRVIIGNLPLLYATKTVALAVDVNGNGAIDPGDTVRYTISVANSGSAPATGATLTDPTPLNTTYVANTTFLNGAGVGQPDGGVSPLAGGIAIHSPGAAAGTIAPGGQAVVTFNVQVNGTVAGGTVISNQGSIASTQLPLLQTDADGNPANGYQPTTFVVGSAQQVAITKAVTVVGGGAALPGSQLDYVVQVTNTGTVAATNVVITDDLGAAPLASQVSYVAGSATLNASAAGVSITNSVITANYGATYGALAPGATATLHFRVTIAAGVATGTQITNTGLVAWNSPALTASASAAISVGGTPGSATLSGHLWYDANFNSTPDAGELNLAGWSVGVYRNNVLLGTVLSDANGLYSVPGLSPTTTVADQYTLKFLAPNATATTAKLGKGSSIFTNGEQQISGISAASGSIVQNLNLPINPDGVVYNSILRTPVPGATLTLVQSGGTVPLPACFDDPAQQGQVTTVSGYYKFDLNFSDPSCPSNANYVIQVSSPLGYVAGPSKLITPATSATTGAFSVPTCPGTASDAVPATTQECEAAASAFAPGTGVAANSAGTTYYLNLLFDNTLIPGHSQIFDNHLPVDPQLGNAVMITKTAAKENVSKGDLIPYTITVNNTMSASLSNMSIVDMFPPGFKYVVGSGRLDGRPVEPVVNNPGRQLTWGNLLLQTNARHTIQLMLIVGAGVGEGKYVNRAQVIDGVTGGAASPVAEATVRVVPDPTLDCSDVIGKVFDDVNLNGYQDEGEKGLQGVRIATVNGLIVTSDKYGRFHIACAVVPDPDRGSNYILKVDVRSLPSGYRMTTENPRVERATRGKMLKFNFGATIHRVVKMDMFDGVFEPGKTDLRVQWRPRIDLLLAELKKGPSVLRLTYYADTESAALANARLQAMKHEIIDRWQKQSGNYDLTVETEVFWRTGGPPEGGGDAEASPLSDDAVDTPAASSAKAQDVNGGK